MEEKEKERRKGSRGEREGEEGGCFKQGNTSPGVLTTLGWRARNSSRARVPPFLVPMMTAAGRRRSPAPSTGQGGRGGASGGLGGGGVLAGTQGAARGAQQRRRMAIMAVQGAGAHWWPGRGPRGPRTLSFNCAFFWKGKVIWHKFTGLGSFRSARKCRSILGSQATPWHQQLGGLVMDGRRFSHYYSPSVNQENMGLGSCSVL